MIVFTKIIKGPKNKGLTLNAAMTQLNATLVRLREMSQ